MSRSTRFSLLVCVCLILGISAKPWDRLKDEALKEAVVSLDGNGRLSWSVEVEPPEDTDVLQYEVDPRMQISKSMTEKGHNGDPRLAEVASDELYLPSMAELLQNQIENVNLLSSVDTQENPSQFRSKMEAAELDTDHMNHPDVQGRADEEPKEDLEEAYIRARQQLDVFLSPLMSEGEGMYYETLEDPNMEPVQSRVIEGGVKRGHMYPEEDKDDLYHIEVPVLHQHSAKAASVEETPSQRKYSEPEEDLDDLYHP